MKTKNHGFQIGEKALRKNHSYPDEPEKWLEVTMNKTYMNLADEFPEDYRTLNGKKWVKNHVKCDICEEKWYALYAEDSPQLQCPNCKQMAYHTILT